MSASRGQNRKFGCTRAQFGRVALRCAAAVLVSDCRARDSRDSDQMPAAVTRHIEQPWGRRTFPFPLSSPRSPPPPRPAPLSALCRVTRHGAPPSAAPLSAFCLDAQLAPP